MCVTKIERVFEQYVRRYDEQQKWQEDEYIVYPAEKGRLLTAACDVDIVRWKPRKVAHGLPQMLAQLLSAL